MRHLVLILVVTTIGFATGCGIDGEKGAPCDRDSDCDSGLVCVSEVVGCSTGNDCWGTCEQECTRGGDCEGGEICTLVGDTRICRSTDYENP